MSNVLADLRFALRSFRKSPIFTAVAVMCLALGIGANTAIFSLIDQVLLRLLPVKNPRELVLLTWKGSHYGSNTGMNAISYPLYKDFRDQNQVFSGLMCRFQIPLSIGYQGQTERVGGELVSGNYFEVLGIGAALGRTISPDDDKIPSGHPVVVLSHDFWINRFAGDPKILGQVITVNGKSFTIIGVAEKGFDGIELGRSPKMFIPIMMKIEMTPGWNNNYNLENRRGRWVNAFGRLKPGVTIEQAKASLQPIFKAAINMEVQQKEFARASSYTREQFLKSTIDCLSGSQGRSFARNQAEKPLWVLMAIVGLVLLIACANVANLLMARATGRQKEIALRLALGAGRGRLIRQLLVESIALSLLGGAAGLLLAVWTDHMLLRFLPSEEFALRFVTTPDLRIFLFSLAVSVLTGILFGLVPALQSTNVNVAPTLKEQAGAVIGGKQGRLRKALVVAQVSLSLLLLIGASLFVRSLQNLRNLNPGFQTDHLVSFSLNPRLSGYTPERSKQTYRELLQGLESMPGAASAAIAVVRVLDNDEWDSSVAVEGYQAKPSEDMNPHYNEVSATYFSTMGIPVLDGREFLPTDEASTEKVGIVNESFAKRYFGRQSAVGRHFGFGGDPGTKLDIRIVGVVRDTKYENLRTEVPRQVFVFSGQDDNLNAMTVYVRTKMDPLMMTEAIRKEVRRLDPNLPIYGMYTMEAQMDISLLLERLVAWLATVFGALATVLASVGLYGVMAYNVSRRTREIGIRMALGAQSGAVTWLVMREVLELIVVGFAFALPACYGLTRLVQSQLFGISPMDPLSLGIAICGLGGVALLAGYIPAFRATQVDPLTALHYE